MHAVNNGTSPAYIADTTTPISSLPGHRKIRSVTTNQYDMSRISGPRMATGRFQSPDHGNRITPAATRNISDVSLSKHAIKKLFILAMFASQIYNLFYCMVSLVSCRGCKNSFTQNFTVQLQKKNFGDVTNYLVYFTIWSHNYFVMISSFSLVSSETFQNRQ